MMIDTIHIEAQLPDGRPISAIINADLGLNQEEYEQVVNKCAELFGAKCQILAEENSTLCPP